MNKLTLAALLALAAPLALAKLPAPDDAAKAKAAEAAAKTAWQGKVDAFQLCKSQDRVAAHYRKGSAADKSAGKKGAEAASTCADPGPFAYTAPEQKPPAAAGAPSSAGTAGSPPSAKTPAANKG